MHKYIYTSSDHYDCHVLFYVIIIYVMWLTIMVWIWLRSSSTLFLNKVLDLSVDFNFNSKSFICWKNVVLSSTTDFRVPINSSSLISVSGVLIPGVEYATCITRLLRRSSWNKMRSTLYYLFFTITIMPLVLCQFTCCCNGRNHSYEAAWRTSVMPMWNKLHVVSNDRFLPLQQ